MTGLEYILKINSFPKSELAKEFGIKKQNITLWIKNNKIPKKWLSCLSVKFHLPEKFFLIGEISEKDKLEIKKYQLEKEQSTCEDEDEYRAWETIIDYVNIDIRIDDLMSKIKDIIYQCRPVFQDEDLECPNSSDISDNIQEYMNITINIFDRFSDIVKGNKQTEFLLSTLRAMELFFDVNVKENELWGTKNSIPSDLVSDDSEFAQDIVRDLYTVLHTHKTEYDIENERKKRFKELLKHYSKEDIYNMICEEGE